MSHLRKQSSQEPTVVLTVLTLLSRWLLSLCTALQLHEEENTMAQLVDLSLWVWTANIVKVIFSDFNFRTLSTWNTIN